MLDYPLLLIFPIAMVYAAAMDFFTMTIPNRVSLALILGFFAAALLGGLGWDDILKHVGAGVLMLAITIALFSQGIMGGGDAKLLSAAALWVGFGNLVDYVFMTALFGGILGVGILMFRNVIPPVIIAGRDWAERLHDKKAGIPYGVALGAAGLWVFPTSEVFRTLSA
jgi:prepilin peptidase CpaA